MQQKKSILTGTWLAVVCVCMAVVLFTLSVATVSQAAPRTVHVVVALCDNDYQGIVPVPKRIGNGQDPAQNLYWGAAYGVKTFFRKQAGWRLLRQENSPAPYILERLVFHHAEQDITLIADAYDGRHIKESTIALFEYAAGHNGFTVQADKQMVPAGGNAGLIVYIGHNGLMDFSLSDLPVGEAGAGRPVAVFACMSEQYFTESLRKAGATPVMMTTNFMCPEAYTTHALVMAWARNEKAPALREAVASVYNKYQKCGIGGARRLFTANTTVK